MNYWESPHGRPFPYGQTRLGNRYNFALYSKQATTVTLHLYRADNLVQPVLSQQLDRFVNKTERIWHCTIPVDQLQGVVYYAYQIDGATAPGDFFDKRKTAPRSLVQSRPLSSGFFAARRRPSRQ